MSNNIITCTDSSAGVSTMVLANNNNGTEDDKTNTNQEITPSKTGGWGAAIFILCKQLIN